VNFWIRRVLIEKGGKEKFWLKKEFETNKRRRRRRRWRL